MDRGLWHCRGDRDQDNPQEKEMQKRKMPVWGGLCKEDTEKAMALHSSILAWKIPWTEEPGRLQSTGSLRVRHDWVTSLSLFTFMHWRRKWQPTPILVWRIPGTEEPGGLPFMGSHRVGHDWSDLAAKKTSKKQRRKWKIYPFECRVPKNSKER